MNQNIKPMTQIDPRTFDLQAQFKRCETWNDADQWDALAVLYFQRGFYLNALCCFRRADACRASQMTVRTDLGFPGNEIEIELVRVATETEVR